MKFPSEPRKSLLHIVLSHACPELPAQLKLFLNSLLPLEQQVTKATALDSSLPFTSLNVWHQYKFAPIGLFVDDLDMVQEIVKAIPISGSCPSLWFDTVIVLDSDEAESTAVQGRATFSAVFTGSLTLPIQDVTLGA